MDEQNRQEINVILDEIRKEREQCDLPQNVSISFQYFLDNQQLLYEHWPDRYLVISGTRVVTTGTDYMDAFTQAQRIGLLPGEFIIQLCGPDERCYTVNVNSVFEC